MVGSSWASGTPTMGRGRSRLSLDIFQSLRSTLRHYDRRYWAQRSECWAVIGKSGCGTESGLNDRDTAAVVRCSGREGQRREVDALLAIRGW